MLDKIYNVIYYINYDKSSVSLPYMHKTFAYKETKMPGLQDNHGG